MCLCFFFTTISREFSESNSECKILNNIVCGISLFNKNNTALSQPSRKMFSAYDMSLAFAQQKNEPTFDIVSQENTGDKKLNPVAVAASLVWRIGKTSGTNDDTKIFYHHDEKLQVTKCESVPGKMFLAWYLFNFRQGKSWFSPLEIGNKSVRSGTCIAWFLTNLRLSK